MEDSSRYITHWFNELNKDIDNSRTVKALKVLGKRAKKFMNTALVSPVSKAYKDIVLKSYKNSMEFIQKKAKQIS